MGSHKAGVKINFYLNHQIKFYIFFTNETVILQVILRIKEMRLCNITPTVILLDPACCRSRKKMGWDLIWDLTEQIYFFIIFFGSRCVLGFCPIAWGWVKD